MMQSPEIVSDAPRLAPRPEAMHKGQAGHVAIVAGSRGMSGAAILCGLGALRGGAGLVRVYCPESVQAILSASEPSLMTVALRETQAGALAHDAFAAERKSPPVIEAGWASALAIGPGLGGGEKTIVAVQDALDQCACPAVVDADAINQLCRALNGPWWQAAREAPIIVTPHPGEMQRLLRHRATAEIAGSDGRRGTDAAALERATNADYSFPCDDASRLRVAHEFAAQSGLIVVLKGHHTVVCDGQRAYVNQTGNPGMASGGMGDVLTGLIAALIGQGLSPFDAAALAVHAHGRAADIAAERIGPFGYTAREVAELVPLALAESSRPHIGFR